MLQPVIDIQPEWQRELAQAFTAPEALGEFLELPEDWISLHQAARQLFPLRVPRPFAALMEKGNPLDPLLRQVFTDQNEFELVEGFSADPLAESAYTPLPGLLHKYKSRVLLIFRGGCAVNCRYCFRRHFPYNAHHVSKSALKDMVAYVSENPAIHEVIFSGGDPLMASDRHLLEAMQAFAHIPHIRRIRIHSRLPVVIPQRITRDFISMSTQLKKPVILVVHINHAQEVSHTLVKHLASLRVAGVQILNQSVLLKGINDTLATQIALQEAVFQAGILPYYLHQLDAVQGAAHFAVTDKEALKLHQAMLENLPGFLVPKLVRERAGEASKTPLR